jgi:hypothetical protein
VEKSQKSELKASNEGEERKQRARQGLRRRTEDGRGQVKTAGWEIYPGWRTAHLKIARAPSGITPSPIKGKPGADFGSLGMEIRSVSQNFTRIKLNSLSKFT